MSRPTGSYRRVWATVLNANDPSSAEMLACSTKEKCEAVASERPGAVVLELEPPEGDQWTQLPDGTWTLAA